MNHKTSFRIVAVSLLIGVALFLSAHVQTVKALVPSIVSINHYDVGSTVWVNITVNHTPPPAIGPSHYVSNIQLEINGSVQDLAQSPQTTETFYVQHSLGPKSNTYMVRARAFCVVHGYSAYSSLVSVPESDAVVLFIVLATVTVVVAKKTLGRRARAIALA